MSGTKMNVVGAVLLGMSLAAPVQAATLGWYTDKNDFLAALLPGVYLNETAWDTNPATVYSDTVFNYTFASSGSLYGGGNWLSTDDPDPSGLFQGTFTSGNINAFGGMFLVSDSTDIFVPGKTLKLDVAGNGSNTLISGGATPIFLGFIGAAPLTTVNLSAPNGYVDGNFGTYYFPVIDDFWVGSASTTAVPEPSTLGMSLAVALLGFGLRRGRRRDQETHMATRSPGR